MLHYVALTPGPLDAAALLGAVRLRPDLHAQAESLTAQAWGLLPGVHRLGFEGGRVLLTLAIGDAQSLLRKERWRVDTVLASSTAQLQARDGPKALARCAERGTRLVGLAESTEVRDAMVQAGFALEPASSGSGDTAMLHAVFQPHWEPRLRVDRTSGATPAKPARCAVIGAGIAGAAVAASLARRGWQVEVLDAGREPATGASGLPVGLFAPHLSPDDNVFSRVSRAGVRATLEQGARVLQAGTDWQPGGLLERRPEDNLGLPAGWADSAGADWSHTANTAQLHAAALPGDSPACWHQRAGWVRPKRLVASLLAAPGIRLHTGGCVAQLHRVHAEGVWQLRDANGALLAEAELVVLAAGPACNALVQSLGLAPLPLDAVRGQLSWGLQGADMALPPFPVNGKGALVGHVPAPEGGLAWHAGSTFERGRTELPLTPQEQQAAHQVNFANLQQLLPSAAGQLAPHFAAGAPGLQTWMGVRCTSPDRLPIVGPLAADRLPDLWVSTAMGARGLTRAILCGELLAARLHAEPLPVEERLARAMGTERLEDVAISA
ncbi:MAG: FAD-dependent 5-carboxymethylaminomethyl-2-thiouridine(34) oxidoreductase MnmC [Giesbergeria sp.]